MLCPDAGVLADALGRGVLKLFVDGELFDPEVAEGLPEWLHSHV